MSAINNPLIRAGQHLVGAVREASEHSLATLFAGDEKALEQRWACSAVQTKDGKWLVVLGEGHVQGGESVRIRVHDSGVFGRGNLRDRAWFEANAEQILLGALFIKDKGGAASVLQDGVDSSKQLRIKIVELTTAPADARWRTEVSVEAAQAGLDHLATQTALTNVHGDLQARVGNAASNVTTLISTVAGLTTQSALTNVQGDLQARVGNVADDVTIIREKINGITNGGSSGGGAVANEFVPVKFYFTPAGENRRLWTTMKVIGSNGVTHELDPNDFERSLNHYMPYDKPPSGWAPR